MKLVIDIPDNELKVPLKNIHLLISNGIVGEVCIKKYDKDKPYFMNLNYAPFEDMGEVSDGYHTFNQLYHQRAVLFATIVNQNKDKSWKSFKHSDGNYCFDSNGEWFIVGIDTPQGSYTYHYAKEYWDMFNCEELECGKEWDGHTEEDVTRLLSLQNEPCDDCISRAYIEPIVEELENICINGDEHVLDMLSNIKNAPPVKPAEKVGHCKQCKWWKDSDGAYRRGMRAESKCPMNTQKVYEGDGYCYLYEPKMQEVEE